MALLPGPGPSRSAYHYAERGTETADDWHGTERGAISRHSRGFGPLA
jgi:hypothetical protein